MRTSRRLTRIVGASLLALATAAGTAAAPAWADPIDEPGNGGGTGNTPGDQGGPSDLKCSGEKLLNGARVIADWASQCDGGGAPWTVGGNTGRTCNTGMAVFRFYGTLSNPVSSYTVTRANPDSPKCDPATQTWYRLYRNVPSDAGGYDVAPQLQFAGETHAANVTDPNDDSKTIDTPGFASGLGAWHSATGQNRDGGKFWSTLNVNEGGTKVGNPSTLAKPNYFATVYDRTKQMGELSPDARDARLRELRIRTKKLVDNAAKTYGQGTLAYQFAGIQYDYIPLNDSGGYRLDPVYGPTGAIVDVQAVRRRGAAASDERLPADRFAEVFSTNPLYSDLNFYNELADTQMNKPLDAAGRDAFGVRGVCYIPLQQRGISGSDGFVSMLSASSGYQLGERFAPWAGGKPGTLGHELEWGANTSQGRAISAVNTYGGAGAASSVFSRYRAELANWYGARAFENSGTSDWGANKQALFSGGAWDSSGAYQSLPAQPYSEANGREAFVPQQGLDGPGRAGQYLSPAEAQAALRDGSACQLQPMINSPAYKIDNADIELEFSTHLAVDAPGYMRAGGNLWDANGLTISADTASRNSESAAVTGTPVSSNVSAISCRIVSGAGEYPVGSACDPRWVTGATLAPTGAETTRGSLLNTSTSTFGDSNWWTEQCTSGSFGAAGCIDPRFRRATNTGQAFNAVLNPDNIRTTVSYTQRTLLLPRLRLFDDAGQEMDVIDPVFVDKAATASYTGLDSGTSLHGTLRSTNAKAPAAQPGGPTTTLSFSYPVWGAVNGGGGIGGGGTPDGSDTDGQMHGGD